MYAVTAGDYSGQYFVPMLRTDTHVECFVLPGQHVVRVPIDDYTAGIETKILDRVAELEVTVYNYLHELYSHETNHN